MLGRGEETTGGRRQVLDPRRHPRGPASARSTSTAGLERGRPGRAPAVRPAAGRRRPASAPGWTGRPACRSSPPSAALGVPEYVVDRGRARTTRRSSTPARVVAGAAVGAGTGRSKKEAEQQAAADGLARRLSDRHPELTADATADAVPELPEVEIVRRGLAAGVAGRTIPRSRCCTRGRSAGTSPAPTTSRPGWPAPLGGRARRGKYLWLPARRRRRPCLVAHLGHERAAARPAPEAPRRAAPAGAHRFTTAVRELRFVDQRTFGGAACCRRRSAPGRRPPRRAGARRRSAAHRPRTRSTRSFDDARLVRRRLAPAATPASSARCSTRRWSRASATSTPTRRCGGPGCTASGRPTTLTRPEARRLLAAVREVMREALGPGGTRFDALYVNVNGAERLLRPLARARTGRRAGRAPGAARRSAASAFMNRSSFSLPALPARARVGPEW